MKKYISLLIGCIVLLSCNDSGENYALKIPEKPIFIEIPDSVELEEFVLTSLNVAKGEHPSVYFELVNLLYENQHYNEAGFVFYIGNNSFKLYNHSNPNFKEEDKRLFDIVSFTYGAEIYDYLHSNLENYSSVVLDCRDWYKENEPIYFNTPKEKEFYLKQLNELTALAIQLKNKPNEYMRELEAEKKAFEKQLNESLSK